MKVCTRCERELPLADFPMRTDQGVLRRRRQCQECANHRNRIANTDAGRAEACRQRVRDRQRERRAALIANKLCSGCMDCGYAGHHAALDFDHRVGEVKLFPIMRDGVNRSWEALWSEVAKCDVVCANCHRIRTYDRLQPGVLEDA